MGKVVVIGGGIIGLSSAFYLQQSGNDVTVIDKDNFTDNCSYGNAGYVCPSHFIPLAAPGIVWKGIKWMLNPKSPFYVKPSFNSALLNWGLKFVQSANKKNVVNAAVPLRDISLLSQHEFEQWSKLPGFDFEYEHKGMLEIFQTQASFIHAEHTLKKAHELGLDVNLLNAEALQQQEPYTKINALGALFFKCDAHLSPDKLMNGLNHYLVNKSVTLVSGEKFLSFEKINGEVKKIITDKNEYAADAIVIAAGAWSRELAALAGTKIPLMPGRGYSLTLENSPYHLNHPVILNEGRVAITPMKENKIRFGGTMEVVPVNTPVQYHRIEGILKAVKDFLPQFVIERPADKEIWYGYRPCSADGLPYIGRTKKHNNIIIATGHSMMGLSLGAGTGKLVSELVNEQPSSIDISAFAPGRFD